MQPTASSAPASAQADRDGAGGVAQVPDDGRARRAGLDRGEVAQRAAAVVDVGEDEQLALPRGGLVVEPQLEAVLRGEPLEHVAVGGELVAVGDEGPRPPRGDHRADELVQVHRRRVAGQHLARPGADHLRDRVARGHRRVDPPRPAGHELLAPLLRERGEPVAGGERQPAERVAVEVDPVAGVDEAVAERRQRVGGVGRLRVRPVGHASHRTTACQSGFAGSRWP